MPRYYFDVHDGEKGTRDEDGLDLDGDDRALKEAVKALPEIARDVLPDGTQRDFVVEVRDAARGLILRAKLSLTVATLWSD